VMGIEPTPSAWKA